MTEPRPDQAHVPEAAQPEVACAKCHTVNPRGSNVCSQCGAHLYVTCHGCGHRNERYFVRCAHCGRRLHRSFWRRMRKKYLPDDRKVKPLYVVLLIIMVLLAYKIIIWLSELRPQPLS
jgi:hypothetical protein